MKKYLFPMLLALLFMACNKDSSINDEPTNTDGDPEGTVTAHLKNTDNGGKSYKLLYGFFAINGSDNLSYGVGSSFSANKHIVKIGKVKNLAAIQIIPKDGWASEEEVRSGYGYIIRYADAESNPHYARVYVATYETDVNGNISDALVKYQDEWETWEENNDEFFDNPTFDPSEDPSTDPSTDPTDDPSDEPTLDPEEDNLQEIEALLAGNYFYSSTVGNLGLGGLGDLQMFFSKDDKKVTLSSRNETPWTISWSVDIDRNITFKGSGDPNNLYGKFEGEINKAGSTISIWGIDTNNSRYEITLNRASQSLDNRVANNISGLLFTAKNAWQNGSSDMTLSVISGQTGTAYIMHAGECRYNITLTLNDIFVQNVSLGQWNSSVTATNADEKLAGSGVYSYFKDRTNAEWYGKVLNANISQEGDVIAIQFDNEWVGSNGVVYFSR